MRKITIFGLILVMATIGFISCQKKATFPVAGSATADDMLSLMPKAAQGIISIDLHSVMETELVRQLIEDQEGFEELQKFTEKTGIDPQQDIYFITIGITGGFETKSAEGVGIINLKYDKEGLLAMLKEEAGDITETEYEGFTLYMAEEDMESEYPEEDFEYEEEGYEEEDAAEDESAKEDEMIFFTFLDESNIVAGNEAEVKSVIDIFQKKADNVLKNEELKPLLAKANKKAMFWGAFLLPPELMDEAATENPMLGNLKGLTSFALYFDYKNNNISAEILVLNDDEEKNKQIADFLNGIKGLGGMVSGEKPELGELINKIAISSAADHVKVSASVPEDLIKTIMEKEKADPETETEEIE
jgi:hypothetical protein